MSVALAGSGGREQEVVEAAGEVAFEAPQCFAFAFAFALLAREVGLGGGVIASAGDRDDVQRVG